LFGYQEIENNEAQRKELQRRIDEAIDSDRNKTFLRILTQYRLLVSFFVEVSSTSAMPFVSISGHHR